MSDRSQSLGEEVANSLSHGLALLAAIVAAPFLIDQASPFGTTHVLGAAVFAATMVFLYLTSTLYHAFPLGRAKHLFMKLDHCAIYLFIAGSYTPFALGSPKGAREWTLFGVVWGLATLGVMLKAFDRLRRPWLSTGLYLVMGWLVLIAALPLLERVSQLGMNLLVTGGLAYTIGAAFFLFDSRLRYGHAIWHGFVVAGSGCHFAAVFSYST